MLFIDESLLKIQYIFSLTGMHLRMYEDYNMKKARIIFYTNFILNTTDIFSAICFLIQGVRMGRSLTALTYATPCLTLGFLADSKCISSIAYHKHIDEIISILRDLEKKTILKGYDNKTVKDPIKFLHLILKAQNYGNWMLIISFPLMPLGLTAYKYFVWNEIDLLLPFFAVYPLDAQDIRYWPFIVLKQIWTSKYCSLKVFEFQR